MYTLKILLVVVIVSTAFLSFKTGGDDIKDYLSSGKQMSFDKENYSLSWSSHPNANYYKQEYLTPGEKSNSFHQMLLLEAIDADMKVDDAVAAKVAELDEIKKKNPVANYNVYHSDKKKTEAVIDFALSDGALIYEWNLYRYQLQKSGGKNYVVLFGYCYRDSLNTDDDLKRFFGHIKDNREDMINNLTQFSIPKVKINN